MASRGTTFAKQDRDRAKKAKAVLKRERREARDAAEATPAEPESVEIVDDITAAELLRLVDALHSSYAEGRMGLDEFHERKAELMARISVS